MWRPWTQGRLTPQAEWNEQAWGFIMLLRMVHNLKLMIVHFWTFPFNIFTLQGAMGN